MPEHRDRDREHPHDRQAEHGVEHELQLSSPSAGPSRTAPKSTKVTPLSTLPTSSVSWLISSGSRLSASAEDHAGDERRDEARSVERARDAVGERGAGGRDHLPPRTRDQVPPAGVDDDRRRQEPGRRPRRRRRSRSPRAAACRRCGRPEISRFHIGGGDGREQQRHADPVVEPALDVQALADPLRHARLGDDRLARARRRSAPARPPGSPPPQTVSWPKISAAATAPSGDGQRQADAEQPQRHADLAAKLRRGRCARRRRTAPARASPRPASARSRCVLEMSIAVEDLGPDQQPERDEQHRRRDRRPRQPPRDRGDAEQRERDDGESPLHEQTLRTGHSAVIVQIG